ncbi:MAG: dTDP-4-dehydrorhamnose reductase [Brevinematales bacterium]|nr:dTDP-4-dehydrorhamnose reductase [Brevinematales bacterium]
MRVLLVGAYGQLGTEFRRFFERNSIEYVPVSRNARDEKTYQTSVYDKDKVSKLFEDYDFDLVINCSAYNNVDKAEGEGYKEAYRTNVEGVRLLSLLSYEKKIPIIHYSTDYVFDGSKTTPYTEDDLTCPISKYGYTKALGEVFLRQINPRSICLRVSWVFGRGENNFIHKLMSWIREGTVKVSTDEISSPTSVKTIVDVSWRLFEESAFGIYHLSSEGECSRYEYAKFVLKVIGWKGKIYRAKQSQFKLPARRPKYSKLDPTKVKDITNVRIPEWRESVYNYLKEEYKL